MDLCTTSEREASGEVRTKKEQLSLESVFFFLMRMQKCLCARG